MYEEHLAQRGEGAGLMNDFNRNFHLSSQAQGLKNSVRTHFFRNLPDLCTYQFRVTVLALQVRFPSLKTNERVAQKLAFQLTEKGSSSESKEKVVREKKGSSVVRFSSLRKENGQFRVTLSKSE